MSTTLEYPPFWLVWNPAGRAPTYKHTSRGSAKAEAERLANLCPGETFVVLQSVCEVERPQPLVWREYSDDIPF